MEIEIYSDVICPWCYVGETRLTAAIASVDTEVVLRWRAFQLDPGAPRLGEPLLPWLAARFGGNEPVRQAMMQVTSVAAGDNLPFDFERAVMANTFDAHRLLWFADRPEAVAFGAGPDTQPELAEALHRAHFADGLDVGSRDVLAALAADAGLDPGRIRRLLATTEGIADVRGQIARAYDLGITSVPTFVFAGRYSVIGVQDVATFRSVVLEVARREGMTPTLPDVLPGQRIAAARDDDDYRVA